MIVGIDEAGRGCWAGPVVAAAVMLLKPINGLNDSKLLNKKTRLSLAEKIKLSAVFGIGWVPSTYVDAHGLTGAVKLAMEQALAQIDAPYDKIIIDGNYNFLQHHPYKDHPCCKDGPCIIRCMVKADSLVPAVSAASILAKVARDQYMTDQSLLFPGYGFEQHVGYGTAKHLTALKQLGACDLHRRSYKPVQAFLI